MKDLCKKYSRSADVYTPLSFEHLSIHYSFIKYFLHTSWVTGIVPTSGKTGRSNMDKISAPSNLTFKDDEADSKQSKYMLDNNAP